MDHVEEIFDLSEVKKRHIPKKSFYEKGDMNKRSIDLLKNDVERVYYISTFNELHGVPSYVTDEVCYNEITFMWVELRDKRRTEQVGAVLQQAIPKPVVLVLDYCNEIHISTALKRYSLLNKEKAVVEASFFSHCVDIKNPSDIEKMFLESLVLKYLSYENLYMMYKDLCNRISLSRVIGKVNRYPKDPSNVDSIMEIVYCIEEKEEMINKLEREKMKCRGLSKRMKLHAEIVHTKEEFNQLLQGLKEEF